MMLPSGNDAAQTIAEGLGGYIYHEAIGQLDKVKVINYLIIIIVKNYLLLK